MRPYSFKANFLKHGMRVERTSHVFLPHEWFHAISCHPKMFHETLLAGRSCNDFWNLYAGWECAGRFPEQQNCHVTVPMRLHGDDVPVKKGASMMCLSLSSSLAYDQPVKKSKFLCMALLLKNLHADTLEQHYDVIRWSLDLLMQGYFPHRDHRGERFKKKSWRWEKKGQPLTPHWKAILIEYLGDWKWYKETFQLKDYYGASSCCHECDVTKEPGDKLFSNFFRTRAVLRLTQAYLDSFHVAPALSRVRGFSIHMLTADYMHVVCLGVALWVVASCLVELCDDGVFGAAASRQWKIRLNLRLHTAFRRFKAYLDRPSVSDGCGHGDFTSHVGPRQGSECLSGFQSKGSQRHGGAGLACGRERSGSGII